MKRTLATIAAGVLAVAGTVLVGYVLLVQVGGAMILGATRAVVMLPRGIVWIAMALQQGLDGWAIASQAVSAVTDVLAIPVVTLSLIALELTGAGALFALGRLLRSGAEDGPAASAREARSSGPRRRLWRRRDTAGPTIEEKKV